MGHGRDLRVAVGVVLTALLVAGCGRGGDGSKSAAHKVEVTTTVAAAAAADSTTTSVVAAPATTAAAPVTAAPGRTSAPPAGPAPTAKKAPATTAAPARPNTSVALPAVRLSAVKVSDPVAGGRTAFTILVPEGWVREGGVVWDLTYSTQATTVMKVRNPNTPQAVESFPTLPKVWDDNGIFGFQPGSVYQGATVVQPMDAVTYLERLVIPTFRGNTFNVVQRVPLPKVVQTLAANTKPDGVTTTSYDAAKVRVRHQQGGVNFEEDFFVTIMYSKSALLPTATRWTPLQLYSFKSTVGTLDQVTPLMQAVVSSVKVDINWYNEYQFVQKLWIDGQMQAIRNAGEISRAIARNSDEISALTRQSYEAQQASQERVFQNVSEGIRGVETYRNPFEGRAVELPSDFKFAWAAAGGGYVLSNDAGFNPNVGSTQEFRLLKVEP